MALIGLPIWYGTFMKRKGEDLEHVMELLKDRSIDYFEVSIDYPWPYKDSDLLERVIKLSLDHGYRIGLHAPWRDLNIASTYESIRRASVDEIYRGVKDFYRYADYIIVHATTSQKLTLNTVRNDAVKALERSLAELKSMLGDDTCICIENLSGGFLSEIQDVAEVVSNICDCLALDIAHAYASYMRHYRHHYASFEEFLNDFIGMISGAKTIIIHYHDIVQSNGLREHVIPCKDIHKHKNMIKLLRRIKPSYFLIEAFIDEHGKHRDLVEVAEMCRELLAWVKIYL